MAEAAIPPCTEPTMYFIGVTTKQSSIMHVFPRWSEILGIGAQIVGHDIAPGAPAEAYERIVDHIRTDPLAKGALVTTHKIDLLEATRPMFDELDSYAQLAGEVSCISKRDGKLRGHAKDPITSGMAWEAFVPPDHWVQTNGHVLCLGAGGAGVSISLYAAGLAEPPKLFTIVDRDATRLAKLRHIHLKIDTAMTFDYILNDSAVVNDGLMEALPPGSLVINATGMGKDRPGSPITDNGHFPQNGLVWELNYRGALDFLHQAQRQMDTRNLVIEDGWVYFLHGWSQVIAEVFDVALTPSLFAQLDEAASSIRS